MASLNKRRGSLWTILAVLICFALVAAACGDDDDDDTSGESTDETTADDGGDDDGEDAGEGDEPAEAGEPVAGGDLVYAIEADSANPWAPFQVSCASSCHNVLLSVADTLVTADEDGQAVGNLAASFEPNEDYTVWTFTIRDGVTFHDGAALDGAAVKYNLDVNRASGLLGPALSNIQTIEADGQTVTFTMGTPWVAFPFYVSSTAGYMMSPDWLRSLETNPLRNPENPLFDQETADAPADGNPSEPVGTGPFVFDSYTPGNGNSFKAVRNEDYWRGDGPDATGEGLPYLDSVEMVVAVDIQSRIAGLESGQFDAIHTANADEINNVIEAGEMTVHESTAYGDTSYVLLNVADGTNESLGGVPMDPEGANADSPLLFQSCRVALAHAIDRERISTERNAGLAPAANGPFPPGSIGYLEDTGYPAYDVAAAQAEMETCLADAGSDSIEFSFNTTNDPFNVETNQLVASMWQEAFGDTVQTSVTPIEQGQYIGLALSGAFQAQAWRNHAGVDPDNQLLWWVSQTASPLGTSALNFGRFRDDVIDGAFATIRANPDPAARQEAAETINQRFGEMVYNWWYYWTVWAVITTPSVNGIEGMPLPDGEVALPGLAGTTRTNQVWCSGGVCE